MQVTVTAPLATILTATLMLAASTTAAPAASLDFHDLTEDQGHTHSQTLTATPVLRPHSKASTGGFALLDGSYGAPFDLYPTFLYVPATGIAGGKRGLLVVLHGCGQTATELMKWGNLQSAASHGLVIAIPSVSDQAWSGAREKGCWDYDLSSAPSAASDKLQHLIELTSHLVRDASGSGLDIDARHVYVAGLSSGGATSLALACRAPELFAGVSSIAAPAVGSSQWLATADGAQILGGGISGAPLYSANDADQRCRDLATRAGAREENLAHFKSQAALITYGDADKNGARAGQLYPGGPLAGTLDAGRYPFVSTVWSYLDAEAFAKTYQHAAGITAPLTVLPPVTIHGGKAKQSAISIGGKDRVALMEIANVGHAWPSGATGPSSSPWIATDALDYPGTLADWLIRHNLRAPQAAGRAQDEPRHETPRRASATGAR